MTSAVLRYAPTPGRYDEVVDVDGATRPTWQAVARALGSFEPEVLLERQRQADRLLDAQGTGHLVHEMSLVTDRHGVSAAERSVSHPWRLDPVPFVIAADEFATLSNAASQRMRALEAVLADCYGDRRLVTEGVLPPGLLHGLSGFRPTGDAASTRRWLAHYAVDLVRDAQGAWHVVHDLTDAPSGLGYTLLNRTVLARVLPDGLRSLGVAAINGHADTLRRALAAAAPEGRTSSRSVVLTGGPADPTYVEHSYLATRLGLHLVEAADVVMRAGRLWLRVLDGLEPIDVVYRRVPDARLDPLEPNHLGGGDGVPGIVWGAGRQGLTLANAYGSAMLEAPELAPHLADAARHLLGEFLALPMLPAGAELGSSPVFVGDSERPFTPQPVVLRLQLARVGDEIVVMQGGAGRVLAPGDDPARPTAQVVKDVWVVGAGGQHRPLRVAAPPQVDFGGSVPKRVADALYWLGRAAERAEVATRTARVITAQQLQDPTLTTFEDGAWAAGATALLRAAQAKPLGEVRVGAEAAEALHGELESTGASVAAQLAALVQEATSVREYLSTTTGRVLGRLARLHPMFADGEMAPDDLDTVLVDLAALSGLMMESTVRGPSWRFLDLGRRLERALAVLGSVEAALALSVPSLAEQPLVEAVLGSNESLVAYRRRYRSEVELQAVLDLLLRDDANPRSLAYQLDRLREHTAGLAWTEGAALVEQASVRALGSVDDHVVDGRLIALDSFVLDVRGPLLDLAEAIVRRWFFDPVNPTLMRGY
ncbi:MAG: circularly permuted type 2 ATP-grasp protein [Ilumatobacteraceae bacterium]